MNRNDVVAAARQWIGTRFQHQQSALGEAVDCIGLVRGVCRQLGLSASQEQIAKWAPHRGYSQIPDGKLLREFCSDVLNPIRIEQAQPGDVALLRFDTFPTHLAIFGDYSYGGLSLIHALAYGRKRVVEHRLDSVWRGRIVAAYSLPGIE